MAGRYDFERLGEIHSERMLKVLDVLSKRGGGMTVETFCDEIYGDGYDGWQKGFWQTAYNDLGILNMIDCNGWFIKTEGFNFLKQMRKKGKI